MVTRLSSEEQRCDRECVLLAKSSSSVCATRENTYRHFRKSSWKRAKTWHGRTTLVILVAQNLKESQKEMSEVNEGTTGAKVQRGPPEEW